MQAAFCSLYMDNKCDYKKQINEELLDSAVAEVIVKLVSNPKFAAMMQGKISMKVDTSAIEQEIAAHEKQLRQSYSVKVRLMEEIDSLDPDDKHYIKRKADLDDRLYKMYDKIEDTENQLVAARAKKMAIEAEKLTGDNIYKVLIYFDKLYSVKVRLMEEIDSLDPDDKHYIKRKADLDDRLYKMYDKIEDTENQLVAARAKKMAIEAEKLTGDNIYKVLIYFDKLYSVMNDQEKRQLMESLLSEIQIYEERQPNG